MFAERQPGRWVAGSNNFQRTRDFAAPAETEADSQLVHVAIVYAADGTISGYRNGEPYGTAYHAGGPADVQGGQGPRSYSACVTVPPAATACCQG